MCGEYSQCLGHTGFAPTHSVCAFPVYTSQALGHSAKNCLRQALGCMHFPAVQVQVLRYSTKVQTWLGLCFAPVPGLSSSGDQVLGARSHPQFKAVTYPLPRPSSSVFWVYNGHTFSGVLCVSSEKLISGCDPPPQADVNQPESQEVLVSNDSCLHFGRGCLSRDAIAPFRLQLPPPACLWWGMVWSAAC